MVIVEAQQGGAPVVDAVGRRAGGGLADGDHALRARDRHVYEHDAVRAAAHAVHAQPKVARRVDLRATSDLVCPASPTAMHFVECVFCRCRPLHWRLRLRDVKRDDVGDCSPKHKLVTPKIMQPLLAQPLHAAGCVPFWRLVATGKAGEGCPCSSQGQLSAAPKQCCDSPPTRERAHACQAALPGARAWNAPDQCQRPAPGRTHSSKRPSASSQWKGARAPGASCHTVRPPCCPYCSGSSLALCSM
jgi:hypothetical protein